MARSIIQLIEDVCKDIQPVPPSNIVPIQLAKNVFGAYLKSWHICINRNQPFKYTEPSVTRPPRHYENLEDWYTELDRIASGSAARLQREEKAALELTRPSRFYAYYLDRFRYRYPRDYAKLVNWRYTHDNKMARARAHEKSRT